jgi:hypothetical protein
VADALICWRRRGWEIGRQYWWFMNSDQKSLMRRKSMYGTALFALGIMAAIVSAVTGSVWLAGVAVAFLLLGLVLLYQVGKSLS